MNYVNFMLFGNFHSDTLLEKDTLQSSFNSFEIILLGMKSMISTKVLFTGERGDEVKQKLFIILIFIFPE